MKNLLKNSNRRKRQTTAIHRWILQGKVRQILDAIGDCIDRKGFTPPDYYDYNEFGREAQKVYDRIYENNCI